MGMPSDSAEFIQKANDDVDAWMDGFYIEGRKSGFNLHCLWAWQEQERRHRKVQADLLEAMDDMCAEFRALDLPYGSSAYCKANSLINKVRARGEA